MPSYSLFSDANWPKLERDWTSWWAGELNRPLVVLETQCPRPGIDWESFDTFLTQFHMDTPVELLLDHCDLLHDATHYYGDAFPRWVCNFGAGAVAGFLGAPWHHDGRYRTTWFQQKPGASLNDIAVRYDPDNVLWRKVQETTDAAIARWGSRACVGYVDLTGNLDVLAILRGTQELLYDLHDAPENVERLSAQITGVWLRYYDLLDTMIASSPHGRSNWVPMWSPTRGYMLQSDFSYMVSPVVFERYVVPDLERCCAALDYPFYHLDGKGELKHLDMLLSLGKLRGIQWLPGEGQPRAEKWPDVLQRIRSHEKLCQVYVDRAGAFRVARDHGGKGFVLVIDERLTDDEATEFLDAFWHEFVPGENPPGSVPRRMVRT